MNAPVEALERIAVVEPPIEIADPVTVLLIHPDPVAREALAREILEAGADEVLEAEDGASGLYRSLAEAQDMVVSAIALPDYEAAGMCAALLERGVRQPVLFVGSAHQEPAIIGCLEAGARAVLDPGEAPGLRVARIRAHLRAIRRAEDVLRLGTGTLDLRRQLFIRPEGEPSKLTVKEMRILVALAAAKGRVVPRAALVAEVWSAGMHVRRQTVETHIYRVRQKVEADPRRPELLLTVRGGYRLALTA